MNPFTLYLIKYLLTQLLGTVKGGHAYEQLITGVIPAAEEFVAGGGVAPAVAAVVAAEGETAPQV